MKTCRTLGKCLFEKLGWFVLAKKRDMNDKIQVYNNYLQKLKHHLEKDRKNDLPIFMGKCENLDGSSGTGFQVKSRQSKFISNSLSGFFIKSIFFLTLCCFKSAMV